MEKRIQEAATFNEHGHSMLSEADAVRIGLKKGDSLKGVYEAALALGVWPERYVRNAGSFTTAEQGELLHAVVAVAGCGGLGGYIAQFLGRMGVGELRLFDPDSFEMSNLNRQVFASEATLGVNKAEAARRALSAINPAVSVRVCPMDITGEGAMEHLKGVGLIADGLDSLGDRARLFERARALDVLMVHATISGFEARVMVLWPKGPAFGELFGESAPVTAEAVLGTPAVTPAVAAGFQCTQIVRALLGKCPKGKATMVHIDLARMETESYHF